MKINFIPFHQSPVKEIDCQMEEISRSSMKGKEDDDMDESGMTCGHQ
jgi:hypothetical protein